MRSWRISIGPLLVASAIIGCDKLSYEHWEQIQVGRSNHHDVERALGYERVPGFQDQWRYERPDRNLSARVHFDAQGVVTCKEWHDARLNIHVMDGCDQTGHSAE